MRKAAIAVLSSLVASVLFTVASSSSPAFATVPADCANDGMIQVINDIGNTITVYEMDGSTEAAKRHEAVREFQFRGKATGAKVLVVTLRIGAVGKYSSSTGFSGTIVGMLPTFYFCKFVLCLGNVSSIVGISTGDMQMHR